MDGSAVVVIAASYIPDKDKPCNGDFLVGENQIFLIKIVM